MKYISQGWSIGWIVVNHGIPVFPTLRGTRRTSIEAYLPDGETMKTWESKRRRGIVYCVRVRVAQVVG